MIDAIRERCSKLKVITILSDFFMDCSDHRLVHSIRIENTHLRTVLALETIIFQTHSDRTRNCVGTNNMPTDFLYLPSELRNGIYERVLIFKHPMFMNEMDLGNWTPDVPWGIFHVSKTVRHEACSVFYTQNCFRYTPYDLDQLDVQNASYIQHLAIDFPRLLCGLYNLLQDEVSTLDAIRRKWLNLKTIKLTREWIMSRGFGGLVNFIPLVNRHLKTIPTLETIIVELFPDETNERVRTRLQESEWTIVEKEASSIEEQGDSLALSSRWEDL